MTGREAAFKALGEYRRTKTADSAINRVLDKSELPAPEKALAMKIFRGVLQNAALCDFYISSVSSIKMSKIEPRALDIMRLTVYQILFLTKIPGRAAVNEGVALAKQSLNPQAAGFINAVTRKIAQTAENGDLPAIPGDPEKRLSILYSHPEWLVREICGRLGEEGAEAFLAASNAQDVPVTAQVNTLRTSAGSITEMFTAAHVEVKMHKWLENCFELRGTGRVDSLSAFQEGYIYVQDAASRLAVIAAGPRPGDCLIDGCAAPGGKSFTAAIMMQNNGRIVSIDAEPAKLRNITEGAKRLGIDIINVTANDASQESAGLDVLSGAADVVLADVPCSGFGVIRKKPDIRYKSTKDIAGLPDIQRKILAGLSALVKPGGVLLYSTCTVRRCENEEVIDWFLMERSGFSPEGFSLPGVGDIPGGMVTLWPHIHGTDGFFICKLRRIHE